MNPIFYGKLHIGVIHLQAEIAFQAEIFGLKFWPDFQAEIFGLFFQARIPSRNFQAEIFRPKFSSRNFGPEFQAEIFRPEFQAEIFQARISSRNFSGRNNDLKKKLSFLSCLMEPTTLQSIMNAKLSKHRFWHCHENRLIKTIQTIPHNLYVSVKSASLYWGLRLILVYPDPQ